jgi:hypothetical protein
VKALVTTGFEALMGASRLGSLNSSHSTVYGLDAEFKLSYLNPAWFKFAEENGGDLFAIDEWSLGKNVFDSIPPTLESYYKELFVSVWNEKRPLFKPKQSVYECSSPELYRRFSMHLYPFGKAGLLVVHSLLVEESHDPTPGERTDSFKEEDYVSKKGVVEQCANCRRVRNLKDQERWDWIPMWIKEPCKNISHGICSPCLHHYYLSKK